MFSKIKIYIFGLGLLALLSLAAGGRAEADGAGGGLANFSGNERLREAVWKLAAFVPAGKNGGERSLAVDGVSGLPPVTINLTFGEPLDPWPVRLKLTFQAEDSRPGAFLTLADARPFGGANISLSGIDPKSLSRTEADNPAALLTDILTRLNARLLKVRPRLGPVTWRENAPGFEAGRAQLLYGARLGPDDLYLVRFDPALFAFRPYHEKEYPTEGQVNIGGWAERLASALALVNSGQYYPDRAYMGLLNRAGQKLSDKAHPQWKGFLVSEPRPEAPDGAPAAAVIDLQTDTNPWRPEHYQNVMQSFMLLDKSGRVRVRDSRNLAGRAAIGQDREGRILLIMTPAAITLFDLATALKSGDLGLSQVMGLDGGFESQLLLRQNGTPFLTGGQFSITENRAVYIPGYHPTLPAVLAVEPLTATVAAEEPAATGPEERPAESEPSAPPAAAAEGDRRPEPDQSAADE